MKVTPPAGDPNPFGATIEVSEIESLSDGHVVIGDGSGAPTTYAAFSSSTGRLIVGATLPAGLVGTPSLAFSGDLDTGAYWIGADSFGLVTAGVLRLTVATAGITVTVPVLIDAGAIGAPSLALAGFPGSGMWGSGGGGLAFSVAGAKYFEIGGAVVRAVNGMFSLFSSAIGADDTAFARAAAGVVEVNSGTSGVYRDLKARAMLQSGANGQAATIQHSTSSATVTAGASHTFASLVPAGSLLIGVTVRVTTVIGTGDGATGFSVGDGTDVDRWGSNISLAADTTTSLANVTVTVPQLYAAALSVVLTAVAGTFDGTGVVRVTAHYISLTAATS